MRLYPDMFPLLRQLRAVTSVTAQLAGSPSSARSYCTNLGIATVLVTNPRHGSPACGNRRMNTPQPHRLAQVAAILCD
jgi:hypothetical protein